MSWSYAGALATLLLASGAPSPAFAACVSSKCSDTALVEEARTTLHETCGCMTAGQSHGAYMKCAKRILRSGELSGLKRPCRNLVLRCERKSICGQPEAVVCCRMKKSGKVSATISKLASKCKNGRACSGSLGRFSRFDACDSTGVCAGVLGTTTTTTSPPTTTTTAAQPAMTCEERRAAFEATLPVPTPAAPGRYVVQLVNESNTTLLASANAAHQVGQPPTPVLPREGTWVIEPRGVLTIDIPPEWERTIGAGAQGPVFWARTGCRYDIEHDLAQCETGSCGAYDCSRANRSAPGPKALAEWTFNDLNGNSAPDVSVVDGVNLNMDIQPLGPRTEHKPADPHWLDHPLTNCGADQRDELWCPAPFRLTRSELAMFIQGSPGGSDIVGCFSNCGKYKYPTEPDLHCTPDPVTDTRCYYWKSFCCAFPIDQMSPYDGPCTETSQCTQNGGCWNNGASMFCACRAFNKIPNCPADQCTFPYTPQTPSNQPPFGLCSDVTNVTGDPSACIGDDTIHYVMPYGLTWPNDPETFFNDAHAYRIIFAPGGTTIPITPAGPIPSCSTLPAVYGYTQAAALCSGVAGKVFAGARPTPASWDCSIGDSVQTDGLLCRW